jgi:NADPH-dependent 2,4-dienoyl-CoA reductase/sulfur reductase-like enzyme
VVVLSSGRELPYDYCVIATGSAYAAPVKPDYAAAVRAARAGPALLPVQPGRRRPPASCSSRPPSA